MASRKEEPSLTGEPPRYLPGIALPEQPSKYYLIMRLQRIILEVDSSIQAIMEKLQSYKSRVSLYFELEYLPISSMEKARQVMEEFMDIWQQALSKRSLLGHFMHVEPNFSEYGPDLFTTYCCPVCCHYGSTHCDRASSAAISKKLGNEEKEFDVCHSSTGLRNG